MEKRSQARNLDVSFLAVVVERGKRHNLREKGTGIYMVDGNALCRRVLLKAVAVAARREVFEPRTVEAHEAIQGARTTFVKREEASRIGRLILVAEDNITNQKVIVHQLGLLGVAADVCANGIEALNRWRHGRYPLLLTDLHMPVMDGFELAATIRAEEDDSVHIGIVALTANILDGEADHCLSIGMDDYLSKPVRIDEIKKVLNYWLPPLANDLAASVPLEAIASRSPDNTLPSVHPVDTNVLKSLVGPDHEVVISFLADFQRSSCSISEELHIAWQSGALQDVGAAAHKLKSSARAVGAIELGECCERIETAVRTGKVNALQDLICQFDHTFTAVDHYLDSCLSPDHGSP
jgi:CheY-like chemotaxis protein/HPt (histidine-containing phosphotransfer) domain-containing protein